MWPPSTSTSSVTLELIADPPASSLARREHCWVSPAVLADLSRSFDATLGNYGQILVSPPAAATGRPAVFTIKNTIAGLGPTDRIVRVYPGVAGGAVGGPGKLFTSIPVGPLGTAQVFASPTNIVTREGLSAVSDVATAWSIAGSGNFFETVTLGDNELLLSSPHGGSIDLHTTEQLSNLIGLMTAVGVNLGAPTIWHCSGTVSGGSNFNRLHITSTDLNEDAFAGLDELWKRAPYQGPIRYRYAVSLHGMTDPARKIVLGGLVNAAEKAILSANITARFTSSSPPLVPPVIEDDAAGLGGSGPNNFINRLSVNSALRPGHGAIQVEQSDTLRNNATDRQRVVEGLADGLKVLLGRNRIYVRDHMADDGSIAATPSFMSPDVCIRTNGSPPPPATLTNKSVTLDNENIVAGGAATVWARAYNTEHVDVVPPIQMFAHVYDSVPATLVQPSMWNPLCVVSLGSVTSNTTPTYNSAPATVGSTAGHRCMVCLLADENYGLATLQSHLAGWSITQFTDFIHRNRLAAWKNYEVVNLADMSAMSVAIPGFDNEELEFRLEVVARIDPAVELEMAIQPELAKRLRIGKKELAKPDEFVRVPVRAGVIDLGRGILPKGARYDLRFEIQDPKGKLTKAKLTKAKKLGTLYIRQLYTPADRPEIEVGRVTWDLVIGRPKPLASERVRKPKTRATAKPPARAKPAAKKAARAKPAAQAKKRGAAKPPARAKRVAKKRGK